MAHKLLLVSAAAAAGLEHQMNVSAQLSYCSNQQGRNCCCCSSMMRWNSRHYYSVQYSGNTAGKNDNDKTVIMFYTSYLKNTPPAITHINSTPAQTRAYAQHFWACELKWQIWSNNWFSKHSLHWRLGQKTKKKSWIRMTLTTICILYRVTKYSKHWQQEIWANVHETNESL